MRGHEVRVLDNLEERVHGEDARFSKELPNEVERMRGDLRNAIDLSRAIEGVDAVFHLAALNGGGRSMLELYRFTDVNVGGTAALLEALIRRGKPLRAFVLASSRAVYGEGSAWCVEHNLVYPEARRKEDLERGEFAVRCPHCAGPVDPRPTAEDRPLKPQSVFAWTKQQQEDLCQYAARTFGLPVVVLRYFNVYGPHQSLHSAQGLVPVFYSRLRARRALSIYEQNMPLHDMVHVSDIVRANLLVLERELPPGTAINIGSGKRHTIAEVANALAMAMDKQPDLMNLGEFRVGDTLHSFANIRRATELLGYRPRIGLRAGISDFVSWADKQESVSRYSRAVQTLRAFDLFGKAEKCPV